MSERTIIAVVSELRASGLTVEQQVLVDELVILTARLQSEADRRAYERERKRAYRCVPGHSGTVPNKERSKENIYINNKPLEGVQGKPLSRDIPAEPLFDEFWEIYPKKVAKGAARKAFRHANARASSAEIIAGAKRYAASKPDPKFTAHAASWLNADRWLDELEKPANSTVSGPWKPIARDEGPNITEAERQANLEKLAKIRFQPKGI